jgi:hypothetical protein
MMQSRELQNNLLHLPKGKVVRQLRAMSAVLCCTLSALRVGVAVQVQFGLALSRMQRCIDQRLSVKSIAARLH